MLSQEFQHSAYRSYCKSTSFPGSRIGRRAGVPLFVHSHVRSCHSEDVFGAVVICTTTRCIHASSAFNGQYEEFQVDLKGRCRLSHCQSVQQLPLGSPQSVLLRVMQGQKSSFAFRFQFTVHKIHFLHRLQFSM